MNEPSLPSDPRQHELMQLAAALSAGELDAAGVEHLEQLLAESEAARRLYVHFLQDFYSLRCWAEQSSAAKTPFSSVQEKILWAELTPAEQVAPGGPSARPVSLLRSVGNYFSQPLQFSTLVALVTTVSLVLTSAQIPFSRNPQNANSSRGAAPTQPTALSGTQADSPPSFIAARLLRAQNVKWSPEMTELTAGASLRGGQKLSLQRGQVEIRCVGGAQVLVSGPAEVRILSPQAIHLARGSLTAATPTAAHGFKVETPHAQVVDLGTEFGVHVEDRGIEVQVFTGKVELQPLDKNAPPLQLEAGRAAKWEAGGYHKFIADAPRHFRRRGADLDGETRQTRQVNVALGRPIIAGSGAWEVTGLAPPSFRFAPHQVVDGDVSDEFGSYWVGRNMTADDFFVIDLQRVRRLQRIELVNTHNFSTNDRGAKDCELWGSTQIYDGELVEPKLLGAVTLPNAAGSGSQLPVHTLHLWTPDGDAPPPEVRFLKFVAKSYYGFGAGLNELRAFAAPNILWEPTATSGPADAANFPQQ